MPRAGRVEGQAQSGVVPSLACVGRVQPVLGPGSAFLGLSDSALVLCVRWGLQNSRGCREAPGRAQPVDTPAADARLSKMKTEPR